jgi:DNA polymerase I
MRIYVTNIVTSHNQAENSQTIKLYGRTENGDAETIEVFGFDDYFYAATDELREAQEALLERDDVKSVEVDGHESLRGESVGKVTVSDYYQKIEIAEILDETYESDVFVTNRLRVDVGLFTGVEAPDEQCHYTELEAVSAATQPRILTFDIETDDRGEFPEHGEKRIISIAAHDSYTGECHGFIDTDGRSAAQVFPNGKPEGFTAQHYDISERGMLERFSEWVGERNFDVITGWNIEDFDAPYILTRMDNIGMDTDELSREGYAKVTSRGNARLKGHSIHDLLLAYKMTKHNELRSFSLDAVAEEELNDTKLEHEDASIWQMYQNDPDRLMRYNLKDVVLVAEIEQEAGVLAFKESLRQEVGVDLEGTTANNSYIEMMVRRKLWERGVVGPDADYDRSPDDYEGGFVFPAFTGIAENVVGVDLASLYPYTMAMFNASPEAKIDPETTEVPYCTAPNGVSFRLDKDGVFKELVDDAIGLKSDYKRLRNQATPGTEEHAEYAEQYSVSKTITNSVYGVTGWEKFFLYDEDVAEAVTLAGQAAIKATFEYINEETPGEVIYGDTDSNYFRLPADWSRERCLDAAQEIVTELNEVVYPELAESFGIPAEDCLWDIEVEAFMERFFQAGQKKFYAYLCTWKDGTEIEPKVSIKGFGSQRSDSALLTKELQETILKNILHGADKAEIGELVHEAANEVSSSDPDWERIGIPGGLGKELENYAWTDGTPQGAQPRAAFICNVLNQTDLGAGSKPMRVYLNEKAPPIEDWEYGPIDVFGFEKAEQVPDWVTVNQERMIETIIVKPMRKILEAIDMDVDAAIKGQQQSGLTAFV